MERPSQRRRAKVRSQTTAAGTDQFSVNLPTVTARMAAGKANGFRVADSGDELDRRILGMEKVVGAAFYRNILREYGRVNQPKLIRDVAIKQRVLESVARGIERLEAVLQRMDPNTVQAVLAKLQAPPLGQIADIKTLQHVVLGLEELAGPTQPHAA